MVEKFNFYDIYGYLLPGLVLIGLLWLPFGLVLNLWPKTELSSALLVLLLAYMIGHVLQNLAFLHGASTIKDRFGNGRAPSELLLDSSDHTFTEPTKIRIAELCEKYFHLDINIKADLGKMEVDLGPEKEEIRQIEAKIKEGSADLESLRIQLAEKCKAIEPRVGEIRSLRNSRKDAFFQARSALLRDKRTSYWEQFEGLYALMRATSVTLIAAAVYFVGWASKGWNGYIPWVVWQSALVFCLLTIVVISFLLEKGKSPGKIEAEKEAKKRDHCEAAESPKRRNGSARVLSAAIGVAIFLAGGLVATGTDGWETKQQSTFSFITINASSGAEGKESEAGRLSWKIQHPRFFLLSIGLVCFAVSARCSGMHKAFAKLFAENIWRDFANIEGAGPSPSLWEELKKRFLKIVQE